jgi:phage baseplate assembly protein W
MATPTGTIIPANLEIVEEQQPSLTFGIDFDRGHIVGMVDGLEAVKQAVFLILQTERYRYLIYTPDYGCELEGLIGRDPLYVQSEIKRRIREALMQDDRIEDVTNFSIQFDGDNALVRFTVISTFGNFEVAQEVTGSV